VKKSRVAGMAYFKTSPASILAGDEYLCGKADSSIIALICSNACLVTFTSYLSMYALNLRL